MLVNSWMVKWSIIIIILLATASKICVNLLLLSITFIWTKDTADTVLKLNSCLISYACFISLLDIVFDEKYSFLVCVFLWISILILIFLVSECPSELQTARIQDPETFLLWYYYIMLSPSLRIECQMTPSGLLLLDGYYSFQRTCVSPRFFKSVIRNLKTSKRRTLVVLESEVLHTKNRNDDIHSTAIRSRCDYSYGLRFTVSAWFYHHHIHGPKV